MKRLRLLLLSFAAVMYIVAVSANNQTYSGSSPIKSNNLSVRWYDEYYSNRIANDGENLWLATSSGLIKYNKSAKNAYNVASELYYVTKDSRFTAIETYNIDGNLIICYSAEMQGAFSYDGAIVEYLGTMYNYNYSYSFAMSPDGGIWASTCGIVNPPVDSLYHGDGFHIKNSISPAMPTAILDMAFDSKNTLWITSYGYYEYLDYIKMESYKDIVALNGTKKITSLAIDSNDNIWYASDNGINCYYQATGQEVCMTKEQYPAMLENRYFGNDIDDSGNIWFTSENNLLKWDGSEFTTYTCDGYEEARSMLCDGNIVWVLLKNDTLLKFQNNEFEAIDLGPAITNTGIDESIAETQNTKAFVVNEMLNIENAEGINSVVVYDAMGKVIASANANGATSTQITLPSTIKGVIMVKVNNEVIKVMLN